MVAPSLLLLADARFPTGGHAHSAGTEQAVAIGDVRDVESLDRYLRARLATTGRTDAAFTAFTCRMGSDPNRHLIDAEGRRPVGWGLTPSDLAATDREYSARMPSPYLRDASRRLGRQLVRVASRTWPSAALAEVAATPGGPHQPIALGAAAASAGARPVDAAVLALHHLAGAVATAGVRLLGLDPIEVAAVQAEATETAAATALVDEPWLVDDPAHLPASGGLLTEILGEHHGSLDARLFVA
ncbi:urease accessory protein [Ilumatobacter fluminis]|uniref:Urease accessory protein n=1 Tax=Ilumatobacter fluminis TaxID=467091 RepID=A0A4R7I1R4_9ACTN|nr:urease accessory UreF family protein [Ilumatobacter fluminis]TDT17385.1 urease accessory protein [Ilumatobacter fluminis]